MTRSRRRHDEEGMTLIETLVTVSVLTVGILTTLAVFSEMGRATYVAQRQAVITSLAQREMERLRVLPYDVLALSASPAADAPSLANTPAASEPLIVDADATPGAVGPGPDSFEVQGVKGKIWRYVTWRAQPCPAVTANVASELGSALGQSQSAVSAAIGDLCPGTQQTKRVTVVIRASDVLEDGRPVRLSTVVADAESSVLASGNYDGLRVDTGLLVSHNGTGAATAPASAYADVTSQSWHLTDTRCDQLTRLPPTGPHVSHDTSRDNTNCTSTDHAPDLMVEAPPAGLVSDPLPDLSSEVARPAAGGLVLARDDRAGSCQDNLTYHPSEDAAQDESARRKKSVHTWATPEGSANYETATSAGRGTFTFWTQTASATQLPGRLCITVWRKTTGEVLGTADYALAAWPSSPTQLAISFDLAHTVAAADERLRLTVRTPSDSGADLLLLYDHAGYPSSLSLTMTKDRHLVP